MNAGLSVVLGATLLLAACQGPQAPTPPPAAPQVNPTGLVFKFYINGLDATAATVATAKTGDYQVMLPPGWYNPRIGGDMPDSNRGDIRPIGTTYLADLFINGGNCVLIYGTIRDATTAAPLEGATVTFLGPAQTTGADGSYRMDLGCPTGSTPFGIGTRFMFVRKPGYVTQQPFGNRAEFVPGTGLQRVDVNLKPETGAMGRR